VSPRSYSKVKFNMPPAASEDGDVKAMGGASTKTVITDWSRLVVTADRHERGQASGAGTCDCEQAGQWLGRFLESSNGSRLARSRQFNYRSV